MRPKQKTGYALNSSEVLPMNRRRSLGSTLRGAIQLDDKERMYNSHPAFQIEGIARYRAETTDFAAATFRC
jgi:hypothetical protein